MSISPYKPSPLSIGSPRSSPFRRPESPSSPPASIRPSTPLCISNRPQTPSKLQNSSSLVDDVDEVHGANTSSVRNSQDHVPRALPPSPTRSSTLGSMSRAREGYDSSKPPPRFGQVSSEKDVKGLLLSGDALAKLPPSQVREMREAFQILDRDSDGRVNKDDVSDVLTNLGLDATPASVSQFFPPSTPHPLPMPVYLQSIAGPLARLSAPSELAEALSAFDDDDSGQIDVAELREALLNTNGGKDGWKHQLAAKEIDRAMDGFTSKRAFSKSHSGGLGSNKTDVFKYREWIDSLSSGGDDNGAKHGF